MPWKTALTVLALCTTALPAVARAQVTSLDEGSFSLSRSGEVTGHENFSIRSAPGARDRMIVARATVLAGPRRVDPILSADTSGFPVAYQSQVKVDGREIQRYAGVTTGTRLGDPDDVVAETVGRPAAELELRLLIDDAEVPASADENFHAAQTAYEARDYSTARALYRAFIQRHHEDARADDAQYYVGQSYLMEDRPATALGELRHVVADYAQGDRVPYALLSMGDAFYRLHACTEAQTSLQAIVRGFASSPVIGDARTRLRDVQHAPRGYCQDTSATTGAH